MYPTCLQKATDKFSAKWANLELVGIGCLTDGDVAPIGQKIDLFVDDLLNDLVPPPAEP